MEGKVSRLWKVVNEREEQALNERFEKAQIQSPFLFRNLYRARSISKNLLDEKGRISLVSLEEIAENIQKTAVPFYSGGENDRMVADHFVHTLTFLHANSAARALIERLSTPLLNQYVEQLIIDATSIEEGEKITDNHVRWAVLSAMLVPLRQNVGSCFATAPAIFIQKEQQMQLLQDFYDLLTTCTLKRTFSGIEHGVPISPSWGSGDLRRSIRPTNRAVLSSPGIEAAFLRAKLTLASFGNQELTVEDFFRKMLCRHYGVSIRAIKAYQEKLEGKQGLFTKNGPTIETLLLVEKRMQAHFKRYTDHSLLKAWEFTLASFSDYKTEFYRWNLYASLGFDPQEEAGIGSLLQEKISIKLEEANRKTEETQQEYNRIVDQVNAAQAMLGRADSEKRARQLKTQLTTHLGHAQTCKNIMETSYQNATHLSNLLAFLLEKFAHHFPEYFQEIYDAEMFDVKEYNYDDSPAGFRLVYKHGRSDPTVWTTITHPSSYQKALISFFIALEPILVTELNWENGDKEISELITTLVHHIQTDTFLVSALKRMARKHQITLKGNPLENIEKLEKKPWSYTSGGTVHSLLKCYYCLGNNLKEEEKKIFHPVELMTFILDTIKALPAHMQDHFEKKKEASLLMYSPQHVFLLQPGRTPLKEGWLDKGFSYTWFRDHVILPSTNFYNQISLDREDQSFLANTFIAPFLSTISTQATYTFSPKSSSASLPSFRNALLKEISPLFPFFPINEHIDAFLRTAFPILSREKAIEAAKDLLSLSKEAKKTFTTFSLPNYCTYQQFHHYLSLALSRDKAFDPILTVNKMLKEAALAPPEPLIFADTNWEKFSFAFAINPGTLDVELWRVDTLGHTGFPMSIWKDTFSEKESCPWGIFITPLEQQKSPRTTQTWLKA